MTDYWSEHLHRAGGDGRSERFQSTRQRTIVLTFATPAAAQAWDDAGQPVYFGDEVPYGVHLIEPSP